VRPLLDSLNLRLAERLCTSPSTEWQDRLIEHLNSLAVARGQDPQSPSCISPQPSSSGRPILSLSTGHRRSPNSSEPPRSRQRRTSSRSPSGSSQSLRSSSAGAGTSSAVVGGDPVDEHEKICSTEENALVSEVGHLSLNEEREVRFHGQASGLHLLDVKDRVDGRNEGGIWLVVGFPALLVHNFNEDSADSALLFQAFPQSSSLATFTGL
jgi:hypothetical protein